jgi:ribonuclease HIII
VDPKQSETQTQEIPAAVKFETNANSAIIVVAVGVSIIALIVLVYCLRSLYMKANFESL